MKKTSSVTLNIDPVVILVSQQELKETIDDIKIGGRNIILNSSWLDGNFNFGTAGGGLNNITRTIGSFDNTVGITYTRTDQTDATGRSFMWQARN